MDMISTLDPVTVEVIRNHFISTARQMKNTLVRASFNPIIYEMVDFSLGIYNRRAELIAEGPGIPLFMGAVSFAIKSIIGYVGEENLEDGDVVLSTYPYFIGSHSQDAVVIRPVFIDGKVFAYTAAKAHWMDIGGKDIYGTDTTDIWQEGLQLYGVKIMKRGVLDRELMEIIRANSRLPDGVAGDLAAQISSCNHGAARVLDLVAKYGKGVVEASVNRILDHGEEMARQAIARMPDGEWTVEASMDNNGLDDVPVKLKARVRISGDELHVDTTGTADQQAGPINCPLATSIAVIRLVTKMMTAPTHEANEGFFRPISTHIPEGSLLNPQAPAPVFLYGWAAMVIGEALFQAMCEIIPENAVARSGGDLVGLLFSGVDRDGNFFAGGGDEAVGQGAAIDQDGENATIIYALGESSNVPAEILEERFPIVVERYELRQDSGGPGRYRGGLGVVKQWRLLQEVNLISTVEQTKYPAWGFAGGKASAAANSVTVEAETPQAHQIGRRSDYKVAAGERLIVSTGGGGGWGDPHLREPSAVLADVRGGYVSLESARLDYGVVIEADDDGYRLDEAATERARKGGAVQPAH